MRAEPSSRRAVVTLVAILFALQSAMAVALGSTALSDPSGHSAPPAADVPAEPDADDVVVQSLDQPAVDTEKTDPVDPSNRAADITDEKTGIAISPEGDDRNTAVADEPAEDMPSTPTSTPEVEAELLAATEPIVLETEVTKPPMTPVDKDIPGEPSESPRQPTADQDTSRPTRPPQDDQAPRESPSVPADENPTPSQAGSTSDGALPRPAIALGPPPIEVFPVLGGGQFTSSFGAPRDGGARQHKGNDIFADKMTPVVATAPGVIVGAPDGPGSKCCYLKVRHDDGGVSVYLHLNNDTPGTDDGEGWGLADGIAKGVEVEVGQVIGYVGDSGNAEGTPPHLHFEYRSDGVDAVDPYEMLSDAPVLVDEQPNFVLAGEPQTLEELPYTGTAAFGLVTLAIVLLILGAVIERKGRGAITVEESLDTGNTSL